MEGRGSAVRAARRCPVARVGSLVPALLLAVSTSRLHAETHLARQTIQRTGVLVIAHRGCSCQFPENTLAAFQGAVACGADLVELDYHQSSDKVPVVLHDELLDRTTDAPRVLGREGLTVGEVTLADLKRLDAGSWFDPRFASQRLPTLAEALDAIQPRSMTLIERKAGDPKPLIDLLRQKGCLEQVVVQSFDWAFVAQCRQLAPTLVLGALGNKPPNEGQLEAAAATGADVLVWNYKQLGRAQIRQIHNLGKKAWAYTVNDPADAQRLVRAGIDGLITDDPATIRQAIAPLLAP
jgi:glycerophosphoryl diester phosphodiesterase